MFLLSKNGLVWQLHLHTINYLNPVPAFRMSLKQTVINHWRQEVNIQIKAAPIGAARRFVVKYGIVSMKSQKVVPVRVEAQLALEEEAIRQRD